MKATNGSPNSAFLQCGSQQKAAGYVIYGPQCAIALTVGKGTHVFTLDRGCGVFRMTRPSVRIPETSREFAINASNQRHWSAGVQAYIADCLAGKDGPRAHDRNIVAVPTSVAAEWEACRCAIPLAGADWDRPIDLTIDGADEVDPSLNLIKGARGRVAAREDRGAGK